METTHLLLVFALLGAVLGILVRMALILMQGASAARARFGSQMQASECQEDGINWLEINALPVPSPPVRPYRRLLDSLKLLQLRWQTIRASQTKAPVMVVNRETLADPVDGTIFQAGENILRCACGTSYHTHSWEWLGAKNGGRCVSCKKTGILVTVAS